MQAKGRLQCWNADGRELGGSCEGCAGKGQAATLEQQRLTARGLLGSCRERVGGFQGFEAFEAWQTAGLNALTREGYVQAKGRLQPWNSKG